MWRADSLEKVLILGKIKGKRRRVWQRMRWLDDTTSSMDINLSTLWETVEDRVAWHAAVHDIAETQTQISDWTIITNNNNKLFYGLTDFMHQWKLNFCSISCYRLSNINSFLRDYALCYLLMTEFLIMQRFLENSPDNNYKT